MVMKELKTTTQPQPPSGQAPWVDGGRADIVLQHKRHSHFTICQIYKRSCNTLNHTKLLNALLLFHCSVERYWSLFRAL